MCRPKALKKNPFIFGKPSHRRWIYDLAASKHLLENLNCRRLCKSMKQKEEKCNFVKFYCWRTEAINYCEFPEIYLQRKF